MLEILNGDFVDIVGKLGIASVFALIIMKAYISQNEKTNETLAKHLAKLESMAGKTILTEEQAEKVFRAVLNQHIRRKLLFVKQKLIANNLKERRKQIEVAIDAELKKITQEEIQLLSTFITSVGDLGDILGEVLINGQWEIFMQGVYDVVFSESTIENKLEDLGALMGTIVNNMVSKITK